jgi:hypothetical protein
MTVARHLALRDLIQINQVDDVPVPSTDFYSAIAAPATGAFGMQTA